VDTESPQSPTQPPSQPLPDSDDKASELQLKDFLEKGREKFDREAKLKAELAEKEELIRTLQSEKTKSVPDNSMEAKLKEKEALLDLKEFLIDNKSKYPLINATNNALNVIEEMKRYYAINKKGLTFKEACELVEERIEEFEVQKAEKLKGTKLYERLYSGVSAKEAAESAAKAAKEVSQPEPKPEVTVTKDPFSVVDRTVNNPHPRGTPMTREEAHRKAQEAYKAFISKK